MATKWMARVKPHFGQHVMSTTLLNCRLKALDQVVEKGWRIDSANDVVMEEAFPLPLFKYSYPTYAPHFAEIMVDPNWHLYLTEQARRDMGIGGSDTQQRLSPFAIGVDEHIRSRSTSPARGSVRQSNSRPRVIGRKHERSQPLIARTQCRQAQPTTPAIQVDQE